MPLATIELIWQLSTDNRLWGAERIRGELLKLGLSVSKRTIQKYLKQMSTWSNMDDICTQPRARHLDKAPKYLIRDNDRKFGHHFANVAAEIEVLRTPIRAPRANAFCE